ncbi:MAG: leucine-rich repeat domain-containing protein [Kiritimatiellae bacterium]|nr:leucine-rich repeat domain-containing protein [Kiritimatiellia bacterium]
MKPFLTFLLAVCITAHAFTASVSDLTYVIRDGEAVITGCNLNATGVLAIPPRIDNMPVAAIGDFAFRYCRNVSAVTLPVTIRIIGKWAFYGCSSLTSITLPPDLTILQEGTFASCKALTSITLPESLIAIEQEAFSDCTGLTGPLHLPGKLQRLGAFAFVGCTSLHTLHFHCPPPAITDSPFIHPIAAPTASLRGVYTWRYALAWFSVLSKGKWQGIQMELENKGCIPAIFLLLSLIGCVARFLRNRK